MRRYQGEALPEKPRIAVISNDALGNYVVATPLLQMLRSAHPDATLHYYGGTRTEELWFPEKIIDWGFPLHGSEPCNSVAEAKGPYDLVVNMEVSTWAKSFTALIAGDGYVSGPCVGPDGRADLAFSSDDRGALAADSDWIAADLTQRYPFLNSGFIGEIFCRLAYLEGPIPAYKVEAHSPRTRVPSILIATAASLPEKLWPVEKWVSLLTSLRQTGYDIGLLGAKPAAQRQFWKGDSGEEVLVKNGLVEDFRGKFTLPQVVGALKKAEVVITIDNGILHLAVAAGAPTVGLFRHGIHRLWAPPAKKLSVLTAGEGREVSDIGVDYVGETLVGAF